MTTAEIPVGKPARPALEAGGVPLDEVAAEAGAALARWTASGGKQRRTLVTVPDAAGLLVHRPGTASPTLNGAWARTPAALTELVAQAETAAWADGAVLVRAAADPGSALGDALAARGWQPLPEPAVPSPFPYDPAAVVGGWVLGRDGASVPTAASMRQTTHYTCGPVATLTGLAALGLAGTPTRSQELGMWREATLGGACDPYGLALAAATRGAPAQVLISTAEPILTEHHTEDWARDTSAFLQREYADRAADAGATAEVRAVEVAELLDVVDAGRVALVLIDQSPMHDDADPHWVLAYGRLGDVLLVDDPWTDEHLGETWVDGAALAVPLPLMDALAGFGDPRYRAVVVLG